MMVGVAEHRVDHGDALEVVADLVLHGHANATMELDRALAEIALLANNMNEGKRESESRRKLVQWQSKIRGKFPSPLVQPHR